MNIFLHHNIIATKELIRQDISTAEFEISAKIICMVKKCMSFNILGVESKNILSCVVNYNLHTVLKYLSRIFL